MHGVVKSDWPFATQIPVVTSNKTRHADKIGNGRFEKKKHDSIIAPELSQIILITVQCR